MDMRTKLETKRLLGAEAQALDVDRKQQHCKMRIRRVLGRAIADPESPDRPSESLASGGTRAARGRAPSGKFPALVTLTREAFLTVWLGGFQGEMEKEKKVLQSPSLAWMAVCVTGAG